jgi:hypothetical protein
MLGFAYWQHDGSGFEAMLAAPTSSPLANANAQQPTSAAPLPMVASGQQAIPGAVGQADAAVIELVMVDAFAPLALAPALPIKEKIAVKKVAEKNETSKVPMTTIPQAPTVKPVLTKQNKVSVAQAATDPDEMLLEGMLRLMKRDTTKDTPNTNPPK